MSGASERRAHRRQEPGSAWEAAWRSSAFSGQLVDLEARAYIFQVIGTMKKHSLVTIMVLLNASEPNNLTRHCGDTHKKVKIVKDTEITVLFT